MRSLFALGFSLAMIAPGCSHDLDGVRKSGEVDAGGRLDAGGDRDGGPTVDAGECPEGFANCNGLSGDGCEAFLRDTETCGDCDTICPAAPNARAVCEAGVCGFECLEGFADCDSEAASGCEADLGVRDHCGSCVNLCGVDDVCSGGVCMSTCPGGTELCGTSCVDTSTSIQHCGSCDNACPAPDDDRCQEAVCSGGTCGISALPDNAICGANDNRYRCCGGACRDLFESDAHCGACGVACRPGSSCNNVDIGSGARGGACAECDPNNAAAGCPAMGTWACEQRNDTGPWRCECRDNAACGGSPARCGNNIVRVCRPD